MTVLVCTTAHADHHEMPPWHPERPSRLRAVAAGLAALEAAEAITDLPARDASRAELERVHDPGYLDGLRDLCGVGGGELDPDTPVAPGSWATALTAAGAGLAALDALRDGASSAAFVAVRPPGHHATMTRGMGFCLLNNVAVTAAAIAAGGERVAIVDWDVHHGNGTQDIFWDHPSVLYASIHQWPAYPGTGRAADVGGEHAGGIVNVPLPPRASGGAALGAVDRIIGPAIAAFAPDWVLISAGFDAHRDDPLADLAWTAGDYALLTRRVLDLAPMAGRTIAFLEGGYDEAALTRCVASTVATLAGTTPDRSLGVEDPSSGDADGEHVLLAQRARELAIRKGSS